MSLLATATAVIPEMQALETTNVSSALIPNLEAILLPIGPSSSAEPAPGEPGESGC